METSDINVISHDSGHLEKLSSGAGMHWSEIRTNVIGQWKAK